MNIQREKGNLYDTETTDMNARYPMRFRTLPLPNVTLDREEQLLKPLSPISSTPTGISIFFGCSSLFLVTFGSGSVLKRIGKSAFSGCKELWEIEVPASVEEIGEGCFGNCSSLSRVTFASGSVLKWIGKSAFSGCGQLREIEIPVGVEVVGSPGVVVRCV